MDFIYQTIFLYSENILSLRRVCLEFYSILQSKAFWVRVSREESIEPPVTSLRECIKHERALEFSLTEASLQLGSVKKDFLPKQVLDLLGNFSLDVDSLDQALIYIKRNTDKPSWLLYFSFPYKHVNIQIGYKTLDDKEGRLFIYRVKRGLCGEIT
nr:hypothetical protein Cduv_45 [Cedratvirus duvanny]